MSRQVHGGHDQTTFAFEGHLRDDGEHPFANPVVGRVRAVAEGGFLDGDDGTAQRAYAAAEAAGAIEVRELARYVLELVSVVDREVHRV